VDTSALKTAIATANAAKAGVPVAADANKIAQGLHFVTQAQLAALNTAITNAQTVADDPGVSQNDVTAAIEALSGAVTVFNAAQQNNTGTKSTGFTENDRTTLIQTANAAKSGVKTSQDGSDIAPDEIWVTKAAMDSLDSAIATLSSELNDTNYLALAGALNTFNAAKQSGKKAKTLTITGLPTTLNDTEIQAGLFTSKDIQGSPTIMGSGTIKDGALQMELYSLIGDGVRVPWNGNGSYYVAFQTFDRKLYISRNTAAFNSNSTTVAYSGFEETEMPGPEPVEGVGNITGTIAFSDYAEPRPEVRIRIRTENGNIDGEGRSYTVDANGNFTIPFTQNFLDRLQNAEQTLYFNLNVGSGSSQLNIELESKTISAANLSEGNINVGSFGTVSLASTTLSGTINVSNDGNPIPVVYIGAYNAQGSYIGQASLESPAAGASWSINIPVQTGGKVRFSVDGYDSRNNGNNLFYKNLEPEATAFVSNQPISNIALNIGDISQGRMSGTISFTNIPSPAPYRIYVSARYGGSNWTWIGGGQRYAITVTGSTGTWAIPRDDNFLAALDSGNQTVTFVLYAQLTQDGGDFTIATAEKTVSKSELGPVNLGSASLAYITLSGTFSGTYNGGTIPYVYISVTKADTGNYISSSSLRFPPNGSEWILYAPSQQSPTEVVLAVQGSDSSSTLFQFRGFSLGNTDTIQNQSISGVNINLGNVSPNSLKVFNNPPSYTVTITNDYIYTSNYTEVTSVTMGSATGGDIVFTTPLESNKSYNVVISAGGVTKFKNNVYFYYGSVGSVDWNDMTEIPAGLKAPLNLGAEAEGYNIVLSWDSVSAANYYRIYRSNSSDGTYSTLTNSNTNSYTNSNLSSGTTYYYKVSTVDSAGNESPKSTAASATVAGLSAPTGLTATASGNSISLTWESVIGASGYRIYRSDSASGTYTQTGSATTTPYTDSGRAAGTYYYKVIARDSYGNESTESAVVSATVSGGEQALAGSVSIGGTPQVGSTLTANTSSLNGSGTISYVWLRDGSPISGATASSHVLASADQDAYIKVRVTRSGMSGFVESSQVGPVTEAGSSSDDNTLPGAKGKLTLTGFNEFNGKYVYFVQTTTSEEYLIGTNAIEVVDSEAVISMVQISGGSAEVPLYTANPSSSGTTVADIYVPYEGSEPFQTVSIMIVNDADGKFTYAETVSLATNYAGSISSNPSNTSFTPSTNNGNITISRSDVKTTAEITEAMLDGDSAIMQTLKYMLILPQ
jgi:hypothetical protein